MPSRFAGTAVQALVILEDVFPVWKIREAFAAGTLPGRGLDSGLRITGPGAHSDSAVTSETARPIISELRPSLSPGSVP